MKHAVDGSVIVIADAGSRRMRNAALDFARRNWSIVLAGTNRTALDELTRYIRMNGGVAHAVYADSRTREGRLRLIAEATPWFGDLDRWADDSQQDEDRTGRNSAWKTLLAGSAWKALLAGASAGITLGLLASRAKRKKQ